VPLLVRLPVATLVVIWGARGNHRWTVGLAATIGLPTIWPQGLSLLLACAVPVSRFQVRKEPAVARQDRVAPAAG
jgi:hypothetical protein